MAGIFVCHTLEAEWRAEINTGECNEKPENNLHPAMQATRHDAAEKCADIAAEGETCTRVQQQPADELECSLPSAHHNAQISDAAHQYRKRYAKC